MANFHVDSSGNLWLGNTSTTFSTSAPFYVTSAGVVKAASGTIGGITIDSSGIESNYSAGSTGFRIESDGDAFFNKVDIRIGGAASQNPSTGFTTLDIGSAKLSEYNDDLWVNSKRVLIFDQDATASASSPSLFLFATYGQPGWYVDDSQIGRTKLYYSNGVNNVFHTESDNTYLHLDGSGIQVGTATGGNSQYIGKNSSGSFGWHNLPSGNDHPDSDHHDEFYTESEVDSLLSGKAASSHGTHVTNTTAVESLKAGGTSGTVGGDVVIASGGGGGGFITTSTRSGQTITINASTTGYINQAYPYGTTKKIGVSASDRFSSIWSSAFYGTFYGQNINDSSKNIKENIVDTALGLDFLNDLEVKDFTMIDTDTFGTQKYTGFIAEDIQKYLDDNDLDYKLTEDYSGSYEFKDSCSHPIVPGPDNEDQTVTFLHDTVEECEAYMPDENRHPHLYFNNFIGPLVKAVQELSTQVSDLTARIEALEG